jgi:hypothetical protein
MKVLQIGNPFLNEIVPEIKKAIELHGEFANLNFKELK